MLIIRLQRVGKRGQAYFRVVISEHTKKAQGQFLELLGSYNPHEKKLEAKKERIDFWVEKGAQVSPTVNNLLLNYGIWQGKPKMQSWKPKRRPESSEGKKAVSVETAQAAPVATPEAPQPSTSGKKEEKPAEQPETAPADAVV